jgi:hypothetical protein
VDINCDISKRGVLHNCLAAVDFKKGARFDFDLEWPVVDISPFLDAFILRSNAPGSGGRLRQCPSQSSTMRMPSTANEIAASLPAISCSNIAKGEGPLFR